MIRYPSRKPDRTPLVHRIRELAAARPRFGYRRIHVLLGREGWSVNHKLVYRLYSTDGLGVRAKRRRKRASHVRVLPPAATALNQRWSMDFVHDRLDDGRRFRALTVVDTFSRECLAVEPDFKMSGRKVAAALDRIAERRALPEMITVDNGTEFYSKALDSWAYRRGVRLDFIRPGKPVENAYIESFNGRLREECLNMQVFLSMADARDKLDVWRKDYNECRPHSSIGNLTPIEFAGICQGKKEAA